VRVKDRVAGAASDKHASPFGARTRYPEGPARSEAEGAHSPGGSERTSRVAHTEGRISSSSQSSSFCECGSFATECGQRFIWNSNKWGQKVINRGQIFRLS
jgi:hypothetical protein